MSTPTTSAPITVETSPIPDQTMALIRQLLMIAGGSLTAHGSVSQSTWQVITGVILAVAPLVYGQLAVRLRATQLGALALDPDVPQVLPKPAPPGK
jgi:hypothetical protein